METFTNAHALCVGVSTYDDASVTDLPEAVIHDAQDLSELLKDRSRCGYPTGNVECLVSGLPGKEPTKQAILDALDLLADTSRVNGEATVLLYFSCHGGQAGSDTYLIPADAKLDSLAALTKSSISEKELFARLDAIQVARLLVLLDCCHAEGLGAFKGPGDVVIKDGLAPSFYANLEQGRGKVIIAACEAEEKSFILGGRNSLFTKHLLDGLRGRASGQDGLIRVFGTFDYLQPRVTAECKKQHPVFKSNLKNNFAVALNNSHEKGLALRSGDLPENSGTSYSYDACIAHAEADFDWVFGHLVPRLEQESLRWTVTDDAIAKYRILSIQDAVESSRYTLLIVSPSYSNDEWTRTAALLGIMNGIEKARSRVIPVRIGAPSREIDLAIRAVVGVDLTTTGPRLEREYQKLLRTLKAD